MTLARRRPEKLRPLDTTAYSLKDMRPLVMPRLGAQLASTGYCGHRGCTYTFVSVFRVPHPRNRCPAHR